MFDPATYDHYSKYGSICSTVDWDLRECLGNTGGQILPGVPADALGEYQQLMLLVRGRLFSLYFMADPKLVELGLLPDGEAYKAIYYQQMMEGLLTQLGTIRPGKDIQEQTDRVLHLIASCVYENRAGKEIEVINRSGKWYVRITDYEAIRNLFGELLREVQRIISEGDYNAAANLVADYGVKVKYPQWHENIYQRFEMLGFTPHQGFVNPTYIPVYDDNGALIDIRVDVKEGFVDQHLRYSRDYSTLPDVN
jgi:dipeptidyl-peptidase-3